MCAQRPSEPGIVSAKRKGEAIYHLVANVEQFSGRVFFFSPTRTRHKPKKIVHKCTNLRCDFFFFFLKDMGVIAMIY